MRRIKADVYSHEIEAKIISKIPCEITEAMRAFGWNVFGVYEVVRDHLKEEKKRSKKRTIAGAIAATPANVEGTS